MYTREKFYFNSSDNTNSIHVEVWKPVGEIKAVLQIIHGMGEHIVKYSEFANYMASNSVLVIGHDQLGHGNSVKTEADLGYFADENGNNYLLKDIVHLQKLMKNKYSSLPYFMLGHSMGSFLLRQIISQDLVDLNGAIIMGSAIKSTKLLKSGLSLIKLLILFKGGRHRSKLINDITFFNYSKKFENKNTGREWLTRDEEITKNVLKDKKVGFIFTLNGFYNLYYSMIQTMLKQSFEQVRINLPLFIVSGDADPVGDFGDGIIKLRKKYINAGLLDVDCKLYEGYRHEILEEVGRKTVFQDILEWINSKE